MEMASSSSSGGGGGTAVQEAKSPANNSFIKRKCLTKENASAAAAAAASPFVIQSVKMDATATSPKFLNDSFETMKLGGGGGGERQAARYLSRRSTFSKHKSAPLSRLAFGEYFSSVCESAHANALASIKSSPLSISANILPPTTGQPLNDIINHIHTRTAAAVTSGNKATLDDNSFSEEQQDHITDLENLIFGNGAQPAAVTNSCKKITPSSGCGVQLQQHLIKQSLDNDAACKNLIGDKSREHVLPVVTSAKHSDLHCISPDTVSRSPRLFEQA